MNLFSAHIYSFTHWLPWYSLVWMPHRNRLISWFCVSQDVGHGLKHYVFPDSNITFPCRSLKDVWTSAHSFLEVFWAQVTIILRIIKHALLSLLACLPLPIGLPPESVIALAHFLFLSLLEAPLRLIDECRFIFNSAQLLNCPTEIEQSQINGNVNLAIQNWKFTLP